MLRSLKYGLFGAILAGLIAAPLAWATVDKSVHLVVDGRPQTVRTTAADVGQLLTSRGYRVDAHDLIAPSPGSALHDGMDVVLRRGRLLHLTINGARRDVWTTAPTVRVALAQLGYTTRDFVSVSRSQRLPLAPSALTIRTPCRVTVVDRGRRSTVTSTDATVGLVLADLDIPLGAHDRVAPGAGTLLSDGMTIRVDRVRHRTMVRHVRIGFATQRQDDAHLLKGRTKVMQTGRPGIIAVRYSLVYLNGTEIARTKLGSHIVRSPQAKILAIGTKQPPPAHAATHRAAHQPNAPRVGAPSPGSAQAIARQMLAARGWGSQSQFDCLVTLWNHESGWRVNAYNPSGAYGIPQALPGSKMAAAGPDWQTSAATQIRWGLGYIAERYGTPCGAWYQWQANGGWY